ncbi:MAG: TadE/TadG family type IV pilus assembly protein [Gammaproteobacteria bacterium]
MENRLRTKKQFRQRGIATIEFAIAAPVLLLLMLATAELGQAFYTYNTLTKAIRDGARYLSVASDNGADAIDVTSADITATRNIVVFGNTAGTGPAVLGGLTPGQITAEQVDANHVRVAADFP